VQHVLKHAYIEKIRRIFFIIPEYVCMEIDFVISMSEVPRLLNPLQLPQLQQPVRQTAARCF
jgi:hypothetical protein